jgi:hypothetical protein
MKIKKRRIGYIGKSFTEKGMRSRMPKKSSRGQVGQVMIKSYQQLKNFFPNARGGFGREGYRVGVRTVTDNENPRAFLAVFFKRFEYAKFIPTLETLHLQNGEAPSLIPMLVG